MAGVWPKALWLRLEKLPRAAFIEVECLATEKEEYVFEVGAETGPGILSRYVPEGVQGAGMRVVETVTGGIITTREQFD